MSVGVKWCSEKTNPGSEAVNCGSKKESRSSKKVNRIRVGAKPGSEKGNRSSV
jgi:hypothetical protein